MDLPGPSTIYNLTVIDGLRWREWSDDLVLYDPRSGNTHRAPAAALDIIRQLQRAPAPFEAICSQFEPDAPHHQQQVREWVTVLLTQLEQAGLVERR